MKDMENVAAAEIVCDEVASLSLNSETEVDIGTELALVADKISPILNEIKENEEFINTESIRKAVVSLEKEIRRTKRFLINSPTGQRTKHNMDEIANDLGRSLGLVMFATLQVSAQFKAAIGELYKDLMSLRFNQNSTTSSTKSPFSEIEEQRGSTNISDILVQLRFGNDEEFKLAIYGLKEFITSNEVGKEWVSEEGIIQILMNRLTSSIAENRLTVIQILSYLVSQEDVVNKEKMIDIGFLSGLVKSLIRDEAERREAVGLLSELSDVPPVGRRIGRIQGCIVMLVAILNGDDDVASNSARKVLNALASNTQNVLHMAEAGYFKPLVHYLKEGSDMSKILMATTISRLELTDQSTTSLGEEGAIEPLIKMLNIGKLEAKLSAISALQNLSTLKENIQQLVSLGIVAALLQLLFSVTSVLMTLREPASAILARIAESESEILVNRDVAHQMLSLLNLSSPIIQTHLLQALNSIAARSSASKVRRKMMENGAVQLLSPFLEDTDIRIRSRALALLCTLSKDRSQEFIEHLGEANIVVIINIVMSSTTAVDERVAAVGILSDIPVSHKKATDILKRENVVPILVSLWNLTATSTPASSFLAESIAGLLIRFTNPFDKKWQLQSAEQGIIPLLVTLLSSGPPSAKCKAATSLAQLSQNSMSLRKLRSYPRWLCVPPSADSFCEVHGGHCSIKTTFCLVKAGAIPPMLQILHDEDREAYEAVLSALSTLLDDQICESGSNYIAKISGVEAIVKALQFGNTKAQEKALWILERIFRVEEHRRRYGEAAQVILIDLAQITHSTIKSTIGKLLAQLELLQLQSIYF